MTDNRYQTAGSVDTGESDNRAATNYLREKHLIDTNTQLLAALQEIASRGPVEGYGSASALRLRLVATQSIARAAIEKAAQ